jgi:hypothetical protein
LIWFEFFGVEEISRLQSVLVAGHCRPFAADCRPLAGQTGNAPGVAVDRWAMGPELMNGHVFTDSEHAPDRQGCLGVLRDFLLYVRHLYYLSLLLFR